MLETGKLLTTSRRNNRPYAILRASHNYLVTDFFLTLLLHLYAALPHLRAGKTDVLNLGRVGKTPAIADLVIEREFNGNDKSVSSSSDHRDVGICLPRTRQRLTRPCGGKSRPFQRRMS
jgi:hypothetical protein